MKGALGFKTEHKTFTLTDPETLALFGVIPSATGLQIGPGTAMRVPAVACAVSLISETIGALPAKLFEQSTKATARDHPAYRLIHDEANDWTSAAQLRTQLTLDALTHGHGDAQVVRTDNGTPFELHRLDPSKVQARTEPDGEPFYMVSAECGHIRFPHTEILHIEAFGGVSPITLGREATALALSFETYMASLFANGGRPSGIIKSPKVLEPDAKKKIAASVPRLT